MVLLWTDRSWVEQQEKREDVLAKCVVSEPRHGEVWQAVAKDPRNAGKNVEEILRMVVDKLE
jgi:pre-mRNA-processing factor 6